MTHPLSADGSELPSSEPESRARIRQKAKSAIEGYLYLAPTLIILTIFVFVPIFTSFRLSLSRVAPFGSQTIFVGVGNYTRLLSDPDYWNSIRVSILFTIGTVVGGITLAVIIGALIMGSSMIIEIGTA